MEKVFDYIAHGGTEADKQAASMEYLEGVLGGVLKERDELAAEIERLTKERDAATEAAAAICTKLGDEDAESEDAACYRRCAAEIRASIICQQKT